MGEWDDINKAAISASGPKLNPGHSYLLEIGGVSYKSLFHGDTFIVETVVHESTDPLLPAGTRPSWTANKKHAPTKGNILCFIGAMYGIDPANEQQLRSTITGQHIEYAIGATNPCKGRFIRATTSETETKSGNDFTIVKWSPYAGPQLPTRLNDAPVAPGVAPSAAPSAPATQPSMPGGFAPPAQFAPQGGFVPPPSFAAPPSTPGVPSNGMPVPMGLSTLPPVGGAPGFGGPPALPGASFGGPPPIPGMGGPPPIPQQPVWPPAGWQQHSGDARYWWKPGTQIPPKLEAELRQLQAAGQA